MKRLVLGVISCGIALPVLAALVPGDKAPDFTARASLAGKEFTFSLRDTLKKGPVVVYFYPAAFTGGCNIQAHTFATNIDKFSAAGASIIGVSLDPISTLNEFSAHPEYCGGKVPVASDTDGSIAKSYQLKIADARPGVKNTEGDEIGHGFAERTTFVLTPDGKIASIIGGVSPKENVEKALEAIWQIGAGQHPDPKATA
jgi:thioredoxin-dependent peroxiredoxin